MFENRSFDHMLGHLSFENLQPEANGLRAPLEQYQNLYEGGSYVPFQIPGDTQLPFDVPHEYDAVATQLARSGVTGKLAMDGFVEAYANATGVNPNLESEPMGFFSAAMVPITSFLARQYCVCDSWFSALPTSTQPNRTMAFCGESAIYKTGLQAIPATGNLFDWMDANQVDWRVYHDGFSFFALYPGLWHHVLGTKFRDYEQLYSDLVHNDAPQVIIVEPSYQDAPHIGPDHPNDNHAPLAIGWGEDFLRRTYEAAIANPAIWQETLMVVYYDEHGGFYDHVPPPDFNSRTTGNPPFAFDSLGPRIPGMLISPWVSPGTVCHELLDHTSVLQLLAEKFTPGTPYSPAVAARSAQAPNIASLSAALNDTANPNPPPAPPSAPIFVHSALGDNIATPPDSAMGQSFEQAANNMITQQPAGVRDKYPELYQWQAAVTQART
jgi:phospholipase C